MFVVTACCDKCDTKHIVGKSAKAQLQPRCQNDTCDRNCFSYFLHRPRYVSPTALSAIRACSPDAKDLSLSPCRISTNIGDRLPGNDLSFLLSNLPISLVVAKCPPSDHSPSIIFQHAIRSSQPTQHSSNSFLEPREHHRQSHHPFLAVLRQTIHRVPPKPSPTYHTPRLH